MSVQEKNDFSDKLLAKLDSLISSVVSAHSGAALLPQKQKIVDDI